MTELALIPSNEEVDSWKSGIAEIDDMESFNCSFRAELMRRNITVTEYLQMERIYQSLHANIEEAKLSDYAYSELMESIAHM